MKRWKLFSSFRYQNKKCSGDADRCVVTDLYRKELITAKKEIMKDRETGRERGGKIKKIR